MSTHTHDFGWALKQLTEGKAVSRSGWYEAGRYLKLQVPDAHSKMTLPYIYATTGVGGWVDRRPYPPNQEDILSGDWGVG